MSKNIQLNRYFLESETMLAILFLDQISSCLAWLYQVAKCKRHAYISISSAPKSITYAIDKDVQFQALHLMNFLSQQVEMATLQPSVFSVQFLISHCLPSWTSFHIRRHEENVSLFKNACYVSSVELERAQVDYWHVNSEAQIKSLLKSLSLTRLHSFCISFSVDTWTHSMQIQSLY